MDFNSFETIDNDDDDVYGEENEADFCAEKNDNDFIDNSEVSNNACKYYRFENITCSSWKMLFFKVVQILKTVTTSQIFVMVLMKK